MGIESGIAWLWPDVVVGTASRHVLWRGAGRYRGNGLSARVMKYCRWNEDKTEYIAIDPRLKDAGSIITIGFERDRAYLANALEIFLISKLQPVHNVVKVGM